MGANLFVSFVLALEVEAVVVQALYWGFLAICQDPEVGVVQSLR